MLRYRPGTDPVRRLDPRAKLAVQAAFAVGVFAHTSVLGLLGFTLVASGFLAAGELHPMKALREYGPFVPIMVLAPLLAGLQAAPPWFDPDAVIGPALASYRTILLLAVGALYVKTTPVRDSRAAIAWLVPGKPGRVLGVGVGIVFRLLPLLQRDLATLRAAIRARLGTERSVGERMGLVGRGGLRLAMNRADGLSVAMQARALSWEPTEPALDFGKRDILATAVAVSLLASVVVNPASLGGLVAIGLG